LAQVPVPEVASALVTGEIAAAFPFEPYGTNALEKGAKLLLAADDLVDKTKLKSDMLRNGMIMTRKFIKEHPELAKRLVWAHLDAVHIMKTDKKLGMEVLQHYTPNIDVALLDKSYGACGWDYDKPPKVWMDALLGWMKEDGLLQKPVSYDEAVDMSLADSYPGYLGYEKLKK
jgi:NitT/TauT family transport system substrate-binding protein